MLYKAYIIREDQTKSLLGAFSTLEDACLALRKHREVYDFQYVIEPLIKRNN